MATGPNQAFVRYMGEIGFMAAHINSGGTAVNKLGQDLTCAVSTNDYNISFNGFRTTGMVYVSTTENSTLARVTSKSTSTVTINPYTCLATGGTATNADFDILIMGLGTF
jgi:hypothetical protein